MIRSYSDYTNLNESSSNSPENIYYNEQYEKFLDNEWSDFSSSRYSGTIYELKFKAGPNKDDYYQVLIEKNYGGDDFYYMQDSKKFQEKLKNEFWKAPEVNYKNLKYSPKCLGDTAYLKASDNYNL